MNIIISALHFDWTGIEDCLERATGELALDGVELSFDDSFAHPHCTRADMEWLAARHAAEKPALSAHIWENPGQGDENEAGDRLLRWLEAARRIGARNLVMHGGSFPDRREGVARVRRIMARVLPSFEKAGVVVNLENHYAYDYRNCRELFSEPWEFLEVLSLDSPSLRFCFDTGHGNMTRNSVTLLRELRPWLNHVHLADNLGRDDDHLMYRQGTVEWDLLFDELRAMRFAGTFCVEFPVREEQSPFRRCRAELLAWRNSLGPA